MIIEGAIMKLKDRVSVTRDDVIIKEPEGKAGTLRFRRIDLRRTSREIKALPFHDAQYGIPISFDNDLGTIEIEENDVRYVVERRIQKIGNDYTKPMVSMQVMKCSGRNSSGFNVCFSVENNRPLNITHICIKGLDGACYYLGAHGRITKDQLWHVKNKPRGICLDAYAQALFETN